MSILDKFKSQSVFNRKREEGFYAVVATEMADGIRNPALWLKALEAANGNSEKQVSEYIRLRVQSLKDDVHITKRVPVMEERITIDKPKWNRIYDSEDLIEMIEQGASILDISHSFSNQSNAEIKLLINQPDVCEQYPLHVAVKRKDVGLVKWLLDAGADKNCINFWGNKPIDIAAKHESIEIVSMLELSR